MLLSVSMQIFGYSSPKIQCATILLDSYIEVPLGGSNVKGDVSSFACLAGKVIGFRRNLACQGHNFLL